MYVLYKSNNLYPEINELQFEMKIRDYVIGEICKSKEIK